MDDFQLPLEVQGRIIEAMSGEDLLNARRVCRSWSFYAERALDARAATAPHEFSLSVIYVDTDMRVRAPFPLTPTGRSRRIGGVTRYELRPDEELLPEGLKILHMNIRFRLHRADPPPEARIRDNGTTIDFRPFGQATIAADAEGRVGPGTNELVSLNAIMVGVCEGVADGNDRRLGDFEVWVDAGILFGPAPHHEQAIAPPPPPPPPPAALADPAAAAAPDPAAINPAAIDPAAADPAAIDPAAIDPAAIDPAAIDPAAIDPAPIDPAAIDPAAIDPAPIDPAAIDPAAIDPLAIGPAAIDPAAIDPADIDPAAIDPAPIDPAAIDPAAIDPAAIGPAAIDPAAIGPAAIDPAAIDPAAGAPVQGPPPATPHALQPFPTTSHKLPNGTEYADITIGTGVKVRKPHQVLTLEVDIAVNNVIVSSDTIICTKAELVPALFCATSGMCEGGERVVRAPHTLINDPNRPLAREGFVDVQTGDYVVYGVRLLTVTN